MTATFNASLARRFARHFSWLLALAVSAPLAFAEPTIRVSIAWRYGLNQHQIAAGMPLNFSVNSPVTGAAYQWFRDGVALADANQSSYAIAAVTLADGGNYSVREISSGVTSWSRLKPVTVHPVEPSVDTTFRAALPNDGRVYTPLGTTANGDLLLDALGQCVRLAHDGSFVGSFTVPPNVGTILSVTNAGGVLTSKAPYHLNASGAGSPLVLPAGFDSTVDLDSAVGLSDGRILIGQGSRIGWLLANGSPDTTMTVRDLGAGVGIEKLFEDARGRILCLRTTPSPPNGYLFSLIRFLASGAPDSTFSVGVGAFIDHHYEVHPGPGDSWATQTISAFRGTSFTRVYAGIAGSGNTGTELNQLTQLIALDDGGGVIAADPATGFPARFLPGESFLRDPHYCPTLQPISGSKGSMWGAIRFARGEIYAWGSFSAWDGHPSVRLVRLWQPSAPIHTLRITPDLASSGGGLRVNATGTPPYSYEWRALDGQPMPADTHSALLPFAALTTAIYGRYQVIVTDARGPVRSEVFNVPDHHLQLAGISARGRVGTGENQLIAGVKLRRMIGGDKMTLLVRGLGPTLTQYGISDALIDPVVEFHNHATSDVIRSDDWTHTPELAGLTAMSGLALPSSPLDATFFRHELDADPFTALLSENNGRSGIGLIEVYDPKLNEAWPENYPPGDFTPGELAGIALRAQVGAGDAIAIGGFIVSAPRGGRAGAPAGRTMRVLLRVSGPTLAAYGIQQPLQSPVLSLYDSSGKLVGAPYLLASGESQLITEAVADLQLTTLTANDAAKSLLYQLPPGAYTAQVSSTGGATGVAHLEVYRVQ